MGKIQICLVQSHLALAYTWASLAHATIHNTPHVFSTNIRCSDAPILPTPSHDPVGGIFSVCAEAVIGAPLANIHSAVIDFHKYSEWNSFVTKVDVPTNVTTANDVYIGMPMTLHTVDLLPFNTSSNEDITLLEPSVIAWQFDDGAGGLFAQAEHPTLLTDLHDGSVRVVSYETYYKLGSVVISALLKSNLQKAFERQADDLKMFVENGGT